MCRGKIAKREDVMIGKHIFREQLSKITSKSDRA